MTIDVRSAVIGAKQYLQSLQDQIGMLIDDLRLEEVELSEDRKFWLITLGFSRSADKAKNPLADLIDSPKYEREYKIFKINSETGEVQSMKIREV
ncbi:MAG: hypothetical protein KME26_01705 [Oscillatoria princeps RMCB-10]|nr:hypothetical protein [Oscillatoria princeps RMCB-10]